MEESLIVQTVTVSLATTEAQTVKLDFFDPEDTPFGSCMLGNSEKCIL